MELVITALFGLESLVRDDLESIGYDRADITVQDGMVLLSVPEEKIATAIARANLWVRHGERVLLSVGLFEAETFDAFYDGVSKIRWEEYIPDSFAFHVEGYSRKSKLFGISACQSVGKKAIVRRLLHSKGKPETSHLFEDVNAGLVKITFGIVSDRVRVMIDTSGDGLHKRGYRPLRNLAPIRETLASGMVRLSRFYPYEKEALVDPFCGSGTIVIEAAMIAHNIAPGMHRHFRAETWPVVGRDVFRKAREEARELKKDRADGKRCFFGSDIDPAAVRNSSANAVTAGVSEYVEFQTADAFQRTPEVLKAWTGYERQLILTNPPYGERMETPEDSAVLFSKIAHTYLDENGFCKDGIRLSVISPDDSFEREAIRPADKRRKLYNGNIRCQMNHYFRRAGDR